VSHHLHTCIVSYNRLDLTKQCYESYLETVTLPFTLVIVDNASEPDVREWLAENVAPEHRVLLLGENKYPGYATNRGWEMMDHRTTLLHRSDNDFAFIKDWCDEVVERFHDPNLGQLGLRTDGEEMFATRNVGGNNVIRRKLWDDGLRYDERPWGDKYPPGYTEDSLFTPAVVRAGWEWGRVQRPCITSLSREDPTDDYYIKSWEIRGIKPQ
jgi:glycosyltransferase involved in cell wall biosynthesis